MDGEYGRGRGGASGGHRGRGEFRGRGRGRARGGRGRGKRSQIDAGGGEWGHSSTSYGKQHQSERNPPIPEDEIEPLRLFVGNLRQNVNKDQLLTTLTPYANVTSAIIVKKKFKGPNYGFISLHSEDDVKKIMELNNQDCYLSGSKLLFRPARKRYISPGEEGFVRESLPDRHYDLTPCDYNKPSIHILVDDVMMKVLEYLPLKNRILCESVCRRWQALLYVIFGSTTQLKLDETFLNQNDLYFDKAMLSKMLLLTGENLKSLCLTKTDYSLKNKLFLTISQLCPNLEELDMFNILSSCFDHIKPLKECSILKCFSAKKCFQLDEKSFKELLTVLPYLEKIDVSHTAIKGDCFGLLPEALKELNISFCKVSKINLRKVSMTCKNLEILDIEKLEIDKEFLEELGTNCRNLRSLKLFPPMDLESLKSLEPNHTIEYSDQIKVFAKLKSLQIVALRFELPNIADNVTDLEDLHIQILHETTISVDFGRFTKLKNAVLISSPFRKQELISLERCQNLQYVTIKGCDDADQETIKKIVKGCPEIKHIKCPKVGIDISFITDINEIMKNRIEPIKISVNEGALSSAELDEVQYDKKKICFDFVEHSLFDRDFDDEFDPDEDLYDSDISFDHMDNFWLNGYDSDNSPPDWMFYGDHFELMNDFGFEQGLHHFGYDSDVSF